MLYKDIVPTTAGKVCCIDKQLHISSASYLASKQAFKQQHVTIAFFLKENSIASEQKWASRRLDTKIRRCGGSYGIPMPSMGRTAYLPISLHNLPSKSAIHLRYIYCIHHFDPIGYLGCDFKYYTKKNYLGN